MTLTISDRSFYLDGKKVFLNSGEIHYFRIKRELWDKHLDAAKEAGLTTVSTYIPWAWHEPDEEQFDFTGHSCPERDLTGWLSLCQAKGLNCIIKPGPFILAEFRGAGLPDWFLKKHGDEIRMKNRKGEVVQSDGVSLFHPAYLDGVQRWYDQVIPLLCRYQSLEGGPVIMMQICNEIGVFSWLAHQADYSLPVRELFSNYLSKKFGDIHIINKLWGTNCQSFSEIELPPDGREPYASRHDRGRDHEWHLFWRNYYGEYLRMLMHMVRERGLKVPFYHNLPGWIYGHGYEFPVNITMYDDLFGAESEILFGVDHIPEFVSYRNMHDDRIINDIVQAVQENKPLFAAEFQSGSREYHVVTIPREMELFYKASIANGLTGWNYYMFSQGRNPERKGYSGDTFYWFTPLTAEGERSSAFPLVKRMNRIIKTSESLIVEAKRRAEVCVLFYPPYYATELERPETGNSDLTFNASAIRRPAYFDGLLKVLQLLNIDYDMLDLTRSNAKCLLSYKQIWCFSTDEMNAEDQLSLLSFARNGGSLVIFPCLPDREMSQQPCTLLRDALGVQPTGSEIIDSPLVDVFLLKDIKCANPQLVYQNLPEHAQVVATTLQGSACGFSLPFEKGNILHLGFWLGFDTEGHKPVYETILQQSGAKLRQAFSSNEFLVVRERFTERGQALLFVGNYYNEAHRGKVTYTHPSSGELINIPFAGNEICWPALYGVLTPVCLEMLEGLNIQHCTSDILEITANENTVSVILHGDRDLAGEMVLEGEKTHQIQKASLDSKPLNLTIAGQRIILSYQHGHQKQMRLVLTLSA